VGPLCVLIIDFQIRILYLDKKSSETKYRLPVKIFISIYSPCHKIKPLAISGKRLKNFSTAYLLFA